MRIEFFNTVFNFDNPNLSYFPAQAGEMELLADRCIDTIEPLIETYQNPILIPIDDIINLYNSYLNTKNVKLVILQDKSKTKNFFEFVKEGYDVQQFINDKLKKFLLDKIFPEGIPSLVEFFKLQQDKQYIKKIVDQVDTIFMDTNYYTMKTRDGTDKKISMFSKIYNKISPLPETEFPINIDKNKLEVELYNTKLYYYYPLFTLQNPNPVDGAWEDVGKQMEYTPPVENADKEGKESVEGEESINQNAGADISNTGLSNCNNKCYLNSVLQMIYNIPELRNAILSADISAIEKILESNYSEPSTNSTIQKNGTSKQRNSIILKGDDLKEYRSKIVTGISALQYIFKQINANKGKAIDCSTNKEYEDNIKYIVNIVKTKSDETPELKTFYNPNKGYKHTEGQGYGSFDAPVEVYNLLIEQIIKFLNITSLNFQSVKQYICDKKNDSGSPIMGGIVENQYILRAPIKSSDGKTTYTSLQNSINSLTSEDVRSIESCDEIKKENMKAKFKESLKVPENEKYIIINLNKVDFRPGTTNAQFIPGTINIDKTLTIDGKEFRLYGSIIFTTSPSHYTYIQYDDNGKFLRYYDDSKLSSTPPTVTENNNGVMFVYKRISTLPSQSSLPQPSTSEGGVYTSNKKYQNLRIRQLYYGRRTRRKLKN